MEKVALVTGAAGGLGQAVAAKLVEAGWRLIVTSRNGERLAGTFGDNHLQVVADCSSVVGSRHILEVAKAHRMLPTAFAHCVGNIRLGALHRQDPVAAAKVLNDFAKTNDKLILRSGSFAGELLDKAGVQALASIPSRNELLAQLLGVMQAPVTGFACALSALAKQREEAVS